ncbi:recombinase family protein [Bacillus sp. JJ722]|uniref:recombinase family protein n=1 Tax=Bacillus sp. JJ722 TaxID=3122973 RepID=UPI002FFE7371
MKCVIYIRVSTEEQAKHGYSILAQKEKLEAYCKSQGWEIIEIYIDDGYSAKDLNRPKFNAMMQEVKKGDIDVVLVYRLDRLTRSVLDLYEILKVLDDHKCKFKSATEVYDTTSAMGKLFITLVAAIAQWERENLAERVRLGMEKKTRLGKWKGGTAPYGYIYTNDELIINSDESKTIKLIYELSKTKGFLTIAKYLTATGVPTKKGGDWHVDSVRDIANNPVYAGYLTFSESITEYKKPPREKTLFDGIHDPIIPREQFWELQDLLDRRRTFGGKRETSNYYFSTILKCARCGHSMSGHKSGGKKTYRCNGKKAGKKCSSHIFLEENLVRTIFHNLDSILTDLNSQNLSADLQSDVVTDDTVQVLEQKLLRIQKLYDKEKQMFKADIITIDELIKTTEHLRSEEREIESQLKSLKKINENQDEINFMGENLVSLWEYANDPEKKQMITTLFSQIVVDTCEAYKRGSGIPREIVIKSIK